MAGGHREREMNNSVIIGNELQIINTSYQTAENVGTPVRQSYDPPSLSNPTREFLQTITKRDLQIHCRDLGFDSVWVNKDELIDKIIQHSRSSNPTTNNISQHLQTGNFEMNETQRLEHFITVMNAKFESVNETLMKKSEELEECKNRLLVAENKIQTLSQKIEVYATSNSRIETCPPKHEKILLIGDSGLKEIKSSDLSEHCIIRTIPGGNIDLLKSWITERLEYPIKECIIYGGAQDVMDTSLRIDKILDDLGELISELKRKNENIIVRVCELVPNLISSEMNDRTVAYNLKLTGWCAENGISFINTELYFKLGMGEVDVNCFITGNDGERLGKDLTRVGAVRLLEAIANRSENNFLCTEWKKVKLNVINNYNMKKSANFYYEDIDHRQNQRDRNDVQNINNRNHTYSREQNYSSSQKYENNRYYNGMNGQRYNNRRNFNNSRNFNNNRNNNSSQNFSYQTNQPREEHREYRQLQREQPQRYSNRWTRNNSFLHPSSTDSRTSAMTDMSYPYSTRNDNHSRDFFRGEQRHYSYNY